MVLTHSIVRAQTSMSVLRAATSVLRTVPTMLAPTPAAATLDIVLALTQEVAMVRSVSHTPMHYVMDHALPLTHRHQ